MQSDQKSSRGVPRIVRRVAFPIAALLCTTLYLVVRVHVTLDPRDYVATDHRDSSPVATAAVAGMSSVGHPYRPNATVDFSACLLVMDDNHFLIEWLAYHYHVLNLRTVVVAVDPNSYTSPRRILHRWKHRIDIVEWSDEDFMTPSEFQDAKRLVAEYFHLNASAQVTGHRARQRLFFGRCIKHIKQSKHKSWTALIDTDEFLSINYDTVMRHLQIDTESASDQHSPYSSYLPPMDEPGSVARFIMRQQQDLVQAGVENNVLQHTARANPNGTTPFDTLHSSPCVQIPRLRYGVQESPSETISLHPNTTDANVGEDTGTNRTVTYNTSRFLTWRWRYHATPSDYKRNRVSKTVIDVSKVPDEDLVPSEFTSIHIPLRSVCTQRRLHIRSDQSYFVIRHYVGSFEQYMYRENDARSRTSEQYEQKSALGKNAQWDGTAQHSISDARKPADNVRKGPVFTTDVRSWLTGFIGSVGEREAARLLEGVGQLELKSWQPITSNDRCALCFFGLPRAYKEMVLPSIVKNVLVPNARHNCDVYVHFYVQYNEKAGRKNNGGSIDPMAVMQLRDAVRAVVRRYNPGATHMPHVAYTHDTEETFWKARNATVQKYQTTVGSDGKPAYYPYNARTYQRTSLDNIVKQWHSEEVVFKLMDMWGKQLSVKYGRVAMLRSDVMYLTPIDIAMLDKGVIDTQNRFATVPSFARMPVNDRMVYGPYDAVKIWATRRFELIEERVALHEDPGMEMHSERFLNATVFPAMMRETGVEMHMNHDICFVRTRADVSAIVSDCTTGGVTRGWQSVDSQKLVEDIVGRRCRERTEGGRKWRFVLCGEAGG